MAPNLAVCCFCLLLYNEVSGNPSVDFSGFGIKPKAGGLKNIHKCPSQSHICSNPPAKSWQYIWGIFFAEPRDAPEPATFPTLQYYLIVFVFSLDSSLQYEPVITAGNEALVHHMEVFQCAAEFDSFPHYNGPCDSKMKPERLNYCRHVLAAWAMGAQVCRCDAWPVHVHS